MEKLLGLSCVALEVRTRTPSPWVQKDLSYSASQRQEGGLLGDPHYGRASAQAGLARLSFVYWLVSVATQANRSIFSDGSCTCVHSCGHRPIMSDLPSYFSVFGDCR